MKRLGAVPLPVLLGLALVSLPRTARAEGDRALSLTLGWATFSTTGEAVKNMTPPTISPDAGGSLGLTYEYAVSSDLSLRGELVGGAFYGGGTEQQSKGSYAGLADVGVTFRFDVLKYVPYAFAGIGGVASTGGPIDSQLDLVVAIGGGLDVLTSRSRSYGVEARLASFGGDITLFTLGVRGTIRWGYF